jgi:exonuclease III
MVMSAVNIFFWNCGVAPLESSKPKKEDVNKVLVMAKKLFIEKGCDLLILCEINSSVAVSLKSNLTGFNVIALINKASTRSNFDMLAITKENISVSDIYYLKLNNLSDEQDKIENNEEFLPNLGRTMKVGVDMVVKIKNTTNSFNVIASHWSSKSNGYSEENREESGDELKEYVKTLVESNRQVILIGDYNDHPQSISILKKLGATQNRHYASMDRKRIYNPSFSFYLPHQPYINGEFQHFHGTWLSRDESIRRNNNLSCQVFDQVMVTSSFVKSGPWHLDEKSTKIVYDEHIMNLLYGGEIDHLPIMTKVEHLNQIEMRK